MQYFDLIITKHAQEQIAARGLKINEVWETFKHPNRTSRNKYSGQKFEKEFENYKITVVAIQNPKNELVAKSVWRNPPLPDTPDAKKKAMWKKYNKSGFFGQLWIQIKQQFGF